MERSDEDLCRGIAGRDAQAFDLLVERHQARAYRLACSILGNEADARDVSQEAFIRLYESAHRFDGRARFSTWFYRILVNLCIDHQRRNQGWRRFARSRSGDDDPDAPASIRRRVKPAPRARRCRAVYRPSAPALELFADQRAAVLLQVQEGFSSREIGAVLKCSETTARVHVHRGIAQLRQVAAE